MRGTFVTPDGRRAARDARRRAIRLAVFYAALLLLAHAIFGRTGLLETRRVRQEALRLRSDVAALTAERARLLEEARRLREDPAAIEAEARRELGLARPGELLVIVRESSAGPEIDRRER